MRGLDPRIVNSVPLSKADTAGNRFLQLCNILSWATAAAASFAVLLDVVLLVSVKLKGAETALHCFGIPITGTVILAEREIGKILKLCAFLDSWLLKGFYISFTGTLLLAFEHDSAPLLDLWRDIVGFVLISAGVLYVTLGALCFHQLRSYQLGKIRRKKLMRQELSTLSAQKQEIEKLLADTESKLQLL